jgi:lipopolysaccharide cholinephosphotransferase
MIDKKFDLELREKYAPKNSDLWRAQQRMTEMLRFIDDICVKNGLVYWIDSGTLLGAVRHGGFIPWDDDTDICMPVPDYNKFIKIMGSRVVGDFVLQTHDTDSNYYSFWAVLRDTKSEYVQNSKIHNMRKYRGLQVDIFPMTDSYNVFLWKISARFSTRIVEKILLYETWKKNFHPITSFFFYLCKYFLYPIFHFLVSRKKDMYRMDYGNVFDPQVQKKYIFPLRRIEYNGIIVNAPSVPESYLQALYGPDWNQVPEERKRVTHNVTFIFY